MTVRTCCLFEQLSGKNFFKLETNEDMLKLMYAALVANNDLMFSFKTFLTLIEDHKVLKWIETEYRRITEFSDQLNSFKVKKVDGVDGKDHDEAILTMTELASSLIVQYGLDPHYVMDEMQLWEIMPYFNTADAMSKNHMIEQRFWTYMTIAPHINTKKISSPEGLVSFEWEKEKKKEKFNKEVKGASAFFAKQAKAEEKDGEQ